MSARCRWISAPRERLTPSRLLPQCGAQRNLGHTQAAFNVAAMLDSGRGAPRDVAQAAIWYARAAAGGNRRAAFNLGQLYESGEGVPANVDLSRAWYAAADLPAARERLAETRSAADRPALVQAPEPLFPLSKSSLEPGLQQVDLVWTSPLEPEAVRFFVELRILGARRFARGLERVCRR